MISLLTMANLLPQNLFGVRGTLNVISTGAGKWAIV